MSENNTHIHPTGIPKIGLGTYKLTGNEAITSIEDALQAGYRHIDTAQMYANEKEVGKAVKNSGLDRDELFITTKIWPSDFKRLVPATENSLRKLDMEQVDLLLLHWPTDEESNKAGLGFLNEVLEKGYTKYVGVSNFTIPQLEQAVELAPIVCNQVEYHPFLSQEKMLHWLTDHDLFLTAYRPLAMGRVLNNPILLDMAKQYHKTPGQIVLRWLIQQDNVAAVPKASTPERQKENIGVFDFELTIDDMQRISWLSKDERLTDPDWAPQWDK
jgi:2,5-diketo-D-gluconate reductase B